jgi:hypothetical protein
MAYKPNQDSNQLIASGSKTSLEGVDVSIGESFVVEDSDEGVNSDSASSSDLSGDESSDSSTSSKESSDSESSEEQPFLSTQDDGDGSSLQLVEVEPPSAAEVLSRLSDSIDDSSKSVTKALGLRTPRGPNITSLQIQRSLLKAIQMIRNDAP